MTKYGYCRVATESGDNLEKQIQLLLKESCDEIVTEVCSGLKQGAALDEILNQLKEGDTLVVTSLDRLTRNSSKGVELVGQLGGKGITVHILNIGMFDNIVQRNLVLQIYAALSEAEYNLRSERIREGKAIARKREGYAEGRPKIYSRKQLDYAMQLLETKTYDEVTVLTNISRSTLIREKSKRKYTDSISKNKQNTKEQ